MIDAKIIEDSRAPSRERLTTFVLTYPRFIHAEFMTHRMLSRNAASSRAIPLKKNRAAVWNTPVVPVVFSKNKPGMQASEVLSPFKNKFATFVWVTTGKIAAIAAFLLEKLGVHKQHANRILEPWLTITVIATATDWDTFFALRFHSAAQPELKELASKMWDAFNKSTPKKLRVGEWHLPFVSATERLEESVEPRGDGISALISKSVARCARVSFLNHDGSYSPYYKDKELCLRLLAANPMHASPAEHQAMAVATKKYSGNFKGWIQYRKTLKGENTIKFIPENRND